MSKVSLTLLTPKGKKVCIVFAMDTKSDRRHFAKQVKYYNYNGFTILNEAKA